MNEPSILDYLQSVLKNDRRFNLGKYFGIQNKRNNKPERVFQKGTEEKIDWRVIVGCLLAVLAQFFLEPDNRRLAPAIVLYLGAAFLLWTGYKKTSLFEFDRADDSGEKGFSNDIKIFYFAISLVFLVAAFLMFTDNTFTRLNVFLWGLSLVFFILSVWEKNIGSRDKQPIRPAFFVLFLLILGLSAFYRFYRLNQVPGEMFSDHAEKLLDVMDVLKGKTSIYFTRNTGREAFQFYLTAAVIKIFKTGISFLSLKIGTAIAGLVTLPFIYLLGKQVANKWVGLAAMLMAGIAYWPNVISRVALRFALYPLFTAPTLFFLFRGLQKKNRNDLIVSGIFLGLGLHGYSPARILPIYVVITFIIYWLHQSSRKSRSNVFWILVLFAFTSFIVFLPLLRYFLENPGLVSYRALSRMTSIENPVEGSNFLIFLNNFWKSMIMFFYDNGQIWVHSIPNRPALDIISAAFFFVGLIYVVKKYLTTHHWEDLAILIAIPVLMMPSILSLAFPNENPSLNRSGGAIVPVFIITGIGFYQCAKYVFIKKEKWVSRVGVGLFLIISIIFSLFQNYDLVFNDYSQQFLANAWNTSEIGGVIADFAAEGNSYDNAYVVPYPYWVDTRLAGINAGAPWKDYALWSEDFETTLDTQGNKLFILKPEDTDSLDQLRLLYPDGREEIFHSKNAGKNFIIYSINEN